MTASLRRIAGRTATALIAAGTLAAALFMLRPPATSGSKARGKFSHLPSGEAVREGYEIQDLSARSLAYIIAALATSAACLVGIVFMMIWLFTSWDKAANARFTPQQAANQAPPWPHLQVNAARDLRENRAREWQALHKYSWDDAAHTNAHIPIERAMRIVIGQSLDAPP
jgi:hypothetical protein